MSERPLSDVVVAELTARFRWLCRAFERLDRLESTQSPPGWVDRLAANPEQLEEISRALILHALAPLFDPVNFSLLSQLSADEPLPLTALMARSGMGRVSLYLRLGLLAQAGLVVLALEEESVRGTQLAQRFTEWIDQLTTELQHRLRSVVEPLSTGEGTP